MKCSLQQKTEDVMNRRVNTIGSERNGESWKFKYGEILPKIVATLCI